MSNSLYFLWLLASPWTLTLRGRTTICYNCFQEKTWVREGNKSLDASKKVSVVCDKALTWGIKDILNLSLS